MCTDAMKTSTNTISNKFNLPLSKIYRNIEDNTKQQTKFEIKFSSTPSLLLPNTISHCNYLSSSSERILSLGFKKQTKWIHRRRRQTVLSRKSQILIPVSSHMSKLNCHFPNIVYSVAIQIYCLSQAFRFQTEALRPRSRACYYVDWCLLFNVIDFYPSLENVLFWSLEQSFVMLSCTIAHAVCSWLYGPAKSYLLTFFFSIPFNLH